MDRHSRLNQSLRIGAYVEYASTLYSLLSRLLLSATLAASVLSHALAQDIRAEDQDGVSRADLLANYKFLKNASESLPLSVAQFNATSSANTTISADAATKLADFNSALRQASGDSELVHAINVEMLAGAAYAKILDSKFSVEEIRNHFSNQKLEFSFSQGTGKIESASGSQFGQTLSFMLLPYLLEAGLCEGNILSLAGLVCAIDLEGDPSFVSNGQFSHPLTQLPVSIKSAQAGSDLSKIAAVIEPVCSASHSTSAADPTPKVGGPSTPSTTEAVECRCSGGVCASIKSKTAMVVVFRLDMIDLLTLAYTFGASFFVTEVEIYGEIYAVINLQYAASGSDAMFFNVPFGFTCLIQSCIDAIKACKDAKDRSCFKRYMQPQNFTIRSLGGYLAHSYSSCTAAPKPYQNQLSYSIAQQAAEDRELSFKRGPFAQSGGPSGTASGSSNHLNPSASYSCTASSASSSCPSNFSTPLLLQAPERHWVYSESAVRTGDQDYTGIFAGYDFLPTPGGLCGITRKYSNQVAEGDLFWFWRGAGQYEGGVIPVGDTYHIAIGDFPRSSLGMPTVEIAWGQLIGHAPITECNNNTQICNYNGRCDGNENFVVCPSECPAPTPNPQPSLCPAQPTAWLTGCSGTSSQAVSGTTTVVVNTASGKAGQAQFQCNTNGSLSYVSGTCQSAVSPPICNLNNQCNAGERWPCDGCPLVIIPQCPPPPRQCQ